MHGAEDAGKAQASLADSLSVIARVTASAGVIDCQVEHDGSDSRCSALEALVQVEGQGGDVPVPVCRPVSAVR